MRSKKQEDGCTDAMEHEQHASIYTLSLKHINFVLNRK